jgi:hypothetical protein
MYLWSYFEPELDNDGNVVEWHEEPAGEATSAPDGYAYLHLSVPSIAQKPRADEIMAALLWEQVPELVNYADWDGNVVYLDKWVPPGVPFDCCNVMFGLNRLKGEPRYGPIWCDKEAATGRYYIIKT